jgi:hypothetical protein
MCLDDANNNGGVCEWHPGLLRSNSVVKANGAIESMNPLNDTPLATAGENKADDATLQQSPIVPVVMPPQSPQTPQPPQPQQPQPLQQSPPPQQHFQVTVPPGTMFGQQLQVPSPDGQLIQFAVPAVAPGTVISVPYTPLGSQ